ncbi:MAG: hypothetical protein ACI9XO_004890 [Paraglaciecola sp.]|jgi:hypothetical protein
MKKICSFLVVFVTTVCFFACQNDTPISEDNEKSDSLINFVEDMETLDDTTDIGQYGLDDALLSLQEGDKTSAVKYLLHDDGRIRSRIGS